MACNSWSCHHSGSPYRSSLAILSFRAAAVHSKPCVHFETTAATISKLGIPGLCAAHLSLASVKERNQIWQKVVKEFRYQEQEGGGGNGSMIEDYMKLSKLRLPLRPWTNNHRSFPARFNAGLAEGSLTELHRLWIHWCVKTTQPVFG